MLGLTASLGRGVRSRPEGPKVLPVLRGAQRQPELIIPPPAGWSQKYVPSFMPSRCPFTGDVLPQYSKSYRAAMPKDDDGEQVDKQEFKD